MSLIKPASAKQAIATPFAFRRSEPATQQGVWSEPTANLHSDAAEAPGSDRLSETDALKGVIRDLAEQLESAKADAAAACEAARAEGYEQGLRDAASREAERSALLSQALEDGLRSLDDVLDRERDVAIELALATLTAILGDPRRHAALVAETAARWAETLRSSRILRVRVSQADFATPDAVSILSKRVAGVTIAADPNLPSGSCLFDLELGHVDASLDVQASAAASFLAEHSSATDRAA